MAEELSWGCTGVSTAISVNGLAFLPIKVAGTHEQKQIWRPHGRRAVASYCLTEPEAGSDVAGIRTTARREGDKYILNGSKTFITGATVAEFLHRFRLHRPQQAAQRHELFHRRAGLASVGKPFNKMGQHASDTAEVILDHVEVPATHRLGDEGTGFLTAMKVFDRSRPVTAAGAVGLAQRALDEAIKYAKGRNAMGKPIWQHQAIGHMIADMAVEVEA